MYTAAESRRWAFLMLMPALRGNLRSEESAYQVNMVARLHSPAGLEKLLMDVLTEAGRIGPGHCDGTLYRRQEMVFSQAPTLNR